MTTIDQTTKERLKHAQEVLGWKADGKEFDWLDIDGKKYAPVNDACELVDRIMHGAKYRIKPAKTCRPFTEKEARVLVGCVLVSPEGRRYVMANDESKDAWNNYAKKEWHYHLPGHPDDLKPCWVEE